MGRIRAAGGCAACGCQLLLEGSEQGVVIHDSTDLREATVFRAPAAPQEALDPTEGWRQSSWKNFYSMIGKESQQDHKRTDDHETVKVGDLHQETKSKKVVKPKKQMCCGP